MDDRISRRGVIEIAGAGVVAALATAGLSGQAGVARAEQPVEPAERVDVYHTDVLVVGAGAAGTRAALEAANSGASVIVLDKKAWGHCGDSGMHYSGRMTSPCFGVDGDNVDVMLKDACSFGEWIVNQQLAHDVLQGYNDDKVTLASENFGDIHIRETETGKPFLGYSANRPRLWAGFKLGNMTYNALEAGVTVMDYCPVTKLLKGDDGSAVGAVAVNFKTGSIFAVIAKSVILATGGDTNLWGAGTVAAQHGGGAANLTGDGHALAAELGVEFRDLEFRSLYGSFGPMTTSVSNFCVLYSSDMSTYRDADGNPMFDVSDGTTPTLRETIVEYERALLEGRGGPRGGVFADIDSFDAGNGDGVPANVAGRYVGDVWDQLKIHWTKQGMEWDNVEVGPMSTYDYGGMVTDIDARTNVEGLYAAGECAMHCGAQYYVFRMFSSAMVMGKRAGAAAAARAAAMDTPATFDRSQIDAEASRVVGLLQNDPAEPIRVHELRRRVQNSAWKGSGALRSDACCQEALDELDAEQASLANMYVSDKSRVCNVEWMESLEIANMIEMARMDTLAARARTESRGTHLRAEYPMRDNDNWIKNVYVFKKDGEYQVEVRDTDTSIYEPPTGKVDMGGGVLEGF